MKKIMKTSQLLILLAAPAVLLSACTKKLDYKTEYKEEVYDDRLISSEPLLYTASQGNSSRTDSGIRPYWKGEDKVVTMRFTEKELQVVEVEKDSRFQENKTNSKVLISIPVEHIQYRCAEDRYGQCTNKEEKNAEIPWNQRTKFKPDFKAMKFSEANLLPAEMDKIFGGECYTETGSQVLDAKIEADAINVRVERTFRVNISCISNATSLGELLSNMTSSAIYHYSFTKLSSIASKDYVPVAYPRSDANTFGFFTTDVNKLDVDGNSIVGSQSELLNRWNPDRSELVYYLSDEFNKPENATIKAATLEGFKRINRGLESAGVKFRIVGKDAEGRQPGDNRNSFVVLVEDPLAASILGYGPSTANPLTGEIVSGRVVMYSGVMKQHIRWTYEEIRRQQQAAKAGVEKVESQKALASANTNIQKVLPVLKIKNQENLDLSRFNSGISSDTATNMSSINLADVKAKIQSGRMVSDKTTAAADTLNIMSKHCTYPAELFNFDEAATTALSDKMGTELKPWMQLSDSEKQKVIDVVLPHVWIPTFVHEVGHNLGLRHNFAGSEDKANFYSAEELKDMKIDRPIAYSSVMDYPYTDLNHLPTLGKYDIAALRFGYQRELITNKNEIVKIEDQKTDLKKFKYCTDENVAVNIGCKRFDEGTTFTEMANHEIKAYFKMQENRNYRNGRSNMSATDDHLYAARVWGTFSNLRLYLTVMSRLKNDYRIDYNHKEYKSDEFLKDLRQATQISMSFLVNVLTTPDLNCVVENKKTKEIDNIPLAQLANGAMTCQEVALNENFALISQFGTFLNHVKDKKVKNPYIDQIDVRGIWIDKLLAAKALFARNLGGRINESSDNFLDLPEGMKMLPAVLAGFAIGVTPVEMELPIADKLVKTPVTLDLADGMLIHKTLSPELMRGLSLPDRDFYLAEWVVNYAKAALRNASQLNSIGEIVADSITAMQYNTVLPVNLKEDAVKVYTAGNNNYIASTKTNIIAALAIDKLLIGSLFNNPEVREEQFKAILAAKMAGKEVVQKDLNKTEKAIAQLPKEKILEVLNRKVPSNGYLIRLLNVMAK